jgi:hypothetical protein
MKGNGRTQARGFSLAMAVSMAALLFVVAKTVYDYRIGPIKDALADAQTETYFAEHSGPFCAFEGVWYDWEDDETITLGCLKAKSNIRNGSFSSAMGPRATSNFSMSGIYDIDPDSCMQVIGKDPQGKDVKFTTLIYVDDKEYPTQMIVIGEKGTRVYIWRSGSGG